MCSPNQGFNGSNDSDLSSLLQNLALCIAHPHTSVTKYDREKVRTFLSILLPHCPKEDTFRGQLETLLKQLDQELKNKG